MLESAIEKAVSKYAVSKGWLSYKFTSPSRRAVTDRIFIKDDVIIFVEFKRLGEKPTKLQWSEIIKLRQQGMKVFVMDDIEKSKRMLDHYA